MNSGIEEDHLRQLFRGAATHVTQLYMYAQRQEKMAYKKGYHEALESIIQFMTETSDKINGSIQVKPLAEFVKKLQIQMQLSTSQSSSASTMNVTPTPKSAQMEVDMSMPMSSPVQNNHNANVNVNLSNNNVLNGVVNNVNPLINNNRPPSLFPFGDNNINHDNNNNNNTIINSNNHNINNNNSLMSTPNPFGFGNPSQDNSHLIPMSAIHINQDQHLQQQQQQQQQQQIHTQQQQNIEYSSNHPKSSSKKRGFFEYYFDSNPPPLAQTSCGSNTQLSLNSPLIPLVPASSPSLHPYFETDYTGIQHNHNLMSFNSQGGITKRARLGE